MRSCAIIIAVGDDRRSFSGKFAQKKQKKKIQKGRHSMKAHSTDKNISYLQFHILYFRRKSNWFTLIELLVMAAC